MTAPRSHRSRSHRPLAAGHLAAWLSLPMVLAAMPACFSEPEELDPSPLGPVAHSAEEAWPEAPQSVPPITHEQIARACVVAGACIPEALGFDQEQLVGLVDLCVHDAVFSAERAIPLSGFTQRNERVELFVSCTLAAADCDGVSACATDREMDLYCEEAGCRPHGGTSHPVSCDGAVATWTNGSSTIQRDCSLAFADCDVDSATGCTDRHFTACPAGVDRSDRCDGDIRLGCDGTDQVSYRDCGRMGGSCGTTTAGGQGCIYGEPSDAECFGDDALGARCDASQLSVCVNGRRITVDAPELCDPAD